MTGTPDFTVGESPFGTPDVDVGAEDLLTREEGDARYAFRPIADADLPSGITRDTEVAALLPWHIELLPMGSTPILAVNWAGTPITDAQCAYNGTCNSASNQNDEINFDVVLAAGTWTLYLLHLANTDAGQYTVTFDGASMTSLGGSADFIEGYVASITKNVIGSITGIVVPTTGKKRLKLKMATKHASSSSYKGRIQKIELQRTA